MRQSQKNLLFPESFVRVQPITDRFNFQTPEIGVLTLVGPGSESKNVGGGRNTADQADLPKVTVARNSRVFLTAASNWSAADILK